MTRFFLRRGLFLIVAGWIAWAVPMWGQDASGAGKTPTYDAVSIKSNKSGRDSVRVSMTSDRYSASGATLKTILLFAYNLKVDEQIAGISGSMADERFDIEAKVDEEILVWLKALPSDERYEQRRLMMQAVLADRFKLKIHAEKRELPIYVLVVAKGGSKLKAANPNDPYPNGMKGSDGIGHGDSLFSHNGSLTGQGVSLVSLTEYLGGQLHRMVENRTGLAGKFNFTLQWTPDDNRAYVQDSGSATTFGPSIFAAVQEQLGLKLEAAKGPVDTIIVDHVEMPSEN